MTLRSWRGLGYVLFCTSVVLAPPAALAQNPPPGSIFDLATVYGPHVLSNYQQFTTSFTADSSSTFVSFAFREVPEYFAFDDASVTAQGSSTNLLADPGFESASFGQNCNHNNALGCPAGWGAWIQPVDVTAIGQVATNTNPYSCPPNLAHSGTTFWCDGSVEGYDAIYQDLATTAGQTYNVSFWLGDNSGQNITYPTIDMLVYAGDALPVGTIPLNTPEPSQFLLLGAALGSVALFSRRRRKT